MDTEIMPKILEDNDDFSQKLIDHGYFESPDHFRYKIDKNYYIYNVNSNDAVSIFGDILMRRLERFLRGHG